MRYLSLLLLFSLLSAFGQTGALTIVGGVIDFSAAPHVLPVRVAANSGALPSTGCKAGELAIVANATLGQQLYENSGAGSCTWTQQLIGLVPSNNLSDVASTSTARTNLGLGGAATQAAILRGTSSAISGTITGIGACTSPTTVSITGARSTMAVVVTPATSPGVGATWLGWVSSNDTVSVSVCSLLASLALTSSTYNVAVIQ